MVFKCLLFLLLFSATINESTFAKIVYEQFSNNDREGNFENLAANVEENLIDKGAPLARRENFEAEGNDSGTNLFQRKFESDDESFNENDVQNENSYDVKRDSEEYDKENDDTRKAFDADEESAETMDNGDESYVFDNDAEFEEEAQGSNIGNTQRERFSSDKKFTRSEENDNSNENNSQDIAEMRKRKICEKGRIKSEKSAGIHGKESKRKTNGKEEESDCPTRTKAGLQKKSVENKQSIFKRNRNWSEDQLNALSYSLSKVRDDSKEFENLKNILYDMGLVNNAPVKKRYSKSEPYMEKEDIKREAEEIEDEDMAKNDIVLRRNDENSKRETNKNKRDTTQKTNSDNASKIKRTNENSRNTREDECSNVDSKSDLSKAGEENTFDENENDNSMDDLYRKKRNDTSKTNVYQKRMEDKIQAKIEAIKEKVKREIKRQEQAKRGEEARKKKEVHDNESKARKRNSRKSKLNKKSISNSGNHSKFASNDLYADQSRRKRANSHSQDVYKQYNGQESPGKFNDYQDEEMSDDRAMYLSTDEGRRKRSDAEENQKSPNNEGAAENEYFGALPEEYNGETNRYKRVRRDRLEDAPNDV